MAKFKTLPCQVCGRRLSLRRNGLVKPHKAPGSRGWEADNCQGVGYRHERWSVGQRLQHHSGSVWVVVEDRGGQYGDYLIRCVVGQRSYDGDSWIEAVGNELITHGEYMHRHGWTPVEDNCMCGCTFSGHDHRRHGTPCRYCEDSECSGYEPDLFVPDQLAQVAS